jgi:hypothetical protein
MFEFPKVRVWFASLVTETASLLKLGIMVVIAAIIYVLSLFPAIGLFPEPLTLLQFGAVVIALIITNQPVATSLPAVRDVQDAIRARTNKYLRPPK